MLRLYSFAVPLLVLTSAGDIPTIPTFLPSGPPTSGIVATDEGTVYFVDSYHQTVWRVQPGQRGATAFVTGRNGRSLQLDEEGNVYGTHQQDGELVLWRADTEGHVVEVGRSPVPELGGHGFVIGDEGELIGWEGNSKRSGVRLYRSDARQSHVMAGGEFGYRDGTSKAARFLPIGGMTRTPDGGLLVTSGPTVRRVSADGNVTTVASGEKLLRPRNSLLARLLGEVQANLTGIAIDDDGSIYVTNAARECVVRIRRDGRVEELMSSDPGWTPTGVATAQGTVYILEYGLGVRVRQVSSDGTATTLTRVRPTRSVASAVTRALSMSS